MIESKIKYEKRTETRHQIFDYLGTRKYFHEKSFANLDNLSKEEVRRIVSELELYQLELRMQKEDLQNANSDLEKMRDLYFHLFEYSPAGYLIVDTKGYILQSNIASQKLLSLGNNDLNHKNICAFTSNIVDSDALHLVLKTCAETEKLQEIEFISTQGRKIYGKVIPAMISEIGEQQMFMLTIFDVTKYFPPVKLVSKQT
ncbi:MAG: PAS domain S-box protein [Oligoflexales bacterium]